MPAYYLHINDQVQGPYSEAEVKAFFLEKTLAPDSLISADGGDWKRLADSLPHFFNRPASPSLGTSPTALPEIKPLSDQAHQPIGDTSDSKSTFSKPTVAAIAFLVAAALTFILNCDSYLRMNVPAFIGSFLGGTLGLWALGGITIFLSSQQNLLRNWLLTIAIIAFFNWYGSHRSRKIDRGGQNHPSKSSAMLAVPPSQH